jgi:hypothetical protein
MTEDKPVQSRGVRIASVVVGIALVVGVFFLVKNFVDSGSDTVVKGHYHVDYAVLAPSGVQAPVHIIYTDPGSGDITTITPDIPWAKDFAVTDPDAVDARFRVDNSSNASGVTCRVLVDDKVLVERVINGGDADSCAVLHF